MGFIFGCFLIALTHGLFGNAGEDFKKARRVFYGLGVSMILVDALFIIIG